MSRCVLVFFEAAHFKKKACLVLSKPHKSSPGSIFSSDSDVTASISILHHRFVNPGADLTMSEIEHGPIFSRHFQPSHSVYPRHTFIGESLQQRLLLRHGQHMAEQRQKRAVASTVNQCNCSDSTVVGINGLSSSYELCFCSLFHSLP